MAKLTDIQGLTRTYANKFASHGIRSANSFLYQCGSAAKRRSFAKKIGIRFTQLTEWIRYADLFRIKGIGGRYVQLLQKAGIKDVNTLARRSPQQLFKQLQSVNDSKHIVRVMPSYRNVSRWVTQAKRMKKVVNY